MNACASVLSALAFITKTSTTIIYCFDCPQRIQIWFSSCTLHAELQGDNKRQLFVMTYLISTSCNAGLNSKVLANDNEMVICPINEPTFGTPRKSQIQTYLEQNEGAGLQHLAIKTHDIFTTMRQLRARSHQAGFDFMPRASDAYYR